MSITFERPRDRLLLLAIVALMPLPVFTQRREPMTAAQIRGLTRDAQSRARGDKEELILSLDASVRERWGDFESFPISIVRREDLNIILSAPYMTFRRTLAEYLRIDRPIASIPWIPAIVVNVSPAQLGAPDILRVVVERAGRSIEAQESRLRPMTFSNGRGEQAVLHGGDVLFALSAFASGPGVKVTVSAVPKTGAPLATSLTDSQLQTLK